MASSDLLKQSILSDVDNQNALDILEELKSGSSMAPTLGAPVPEDKDEEVLKIEQALRDLDMSPEERYRKVLEDAKISRDEALRILDTIIVQLEPYVETMKINDKVSVTLKTRSQNDVLRLYQALEKGQPKFAATADLEEARYKVATSLVRYNNRAFDTSTPDGLKTTLDWLSAIPLPTFLLLQSKLYDFDYKIMTVFSEGYLQNF